MYGLVDVEMVKEISNLMKGEDDLAEKKPGIVAQLIESLWQKPGQQVRSEQGQQTACAEG